MIESVDQHRYRIVVGCLAAIAAAAPGVLSVIDTYRWEVVLVKAAYGLPLLWWHRAAVAFWFATFLILVSEVSLAAFEQSSGEWAFIPLAGAAFAVGLSGRRRDQLRGVLGFVMVISVAVVVNHLTAAPGFGIGLSPLVTITLIAVSWFMGGEAQRVREQVKLAETSLRRAAFDAEEQARNAVAAERLRIAHDIHDLASHSLSALVIRTEVAHVRLGAIDDQLATEIRSIGDDGRRAMEQLRSMLLLVEPSVLTTNESSESSDDVDLHQVLSVEIGLSKRKESITHTSVAGIPDVPAGVAEAMQRFVREALANADRHAPSAQVKVHAELHDSAIVVSVCNEPSTNSAPESAICTSSGLGLALTRQRLARCGAILVVGSTPTGGFEARATLPWPDNATGVLTSQLTPALSV